MPRPPSRSARPSLLRDRRGGSTVEYGLILAFIFLMMFGALMNLGGVTKGMWNDVAARVTNAQ